LIQQYVNPGNTELFPIFSKIAQNYEQFECNHLKVFYRTEEYMASGSVVSAGLCCLATNFDPDAANFATFTQAENYEHSISGAPFSGIIEHDILGEHKKRFGTAKRGGNDLSLNNYFVNYAPNQLAPGATPAKFYDMGNLQVLVNGTQAGVIGELWIEYSFTLIRRLQLPGAPQGGVAHWYGPLPTTADNFASSVLQPGYTLTGLNAPITAAANVITFPPGIPGNYSIVMDVVGSTSATGLGVSGVSGLVPLNLFGISAKDQHYYLESAAGTANVPVFMAVAYTVPAAGGTLTIAPSTLVGGESMDLFIFALPSTVLTVDEKEQLEIDDLKSIVSHLTSRYVRLEKLLMSLDATRGISEDGDDENDDEKYFVPDIEDTVGPSSTPPRPLAVRRRVEIISSSKK
jgi:hypothetical protein